MFLKPARGLLVRDPALMDALPKEGRDVPRDEYWLRRLADGDVREVDPEPEAKPARHKAKAEDKPEPDAAPAEALPVLTEKDAR